MTTVAQTHTHHKAFYATLDEAHGVLTMDAQGAIWFRNEATEELTLITPEMFAFVQAHGEVGLCETQKLADERHGGYATIACSRAA